MHHLYTHCPLYIPTSRKTLQSTPPSSSSSKPALDPKSPRALGISWVGFMDHHHQHHHHHNMKPDTHEPQMLTRQTSGSKGGSCLCSPTTHAGSFRCRLHRSPSLNRTKSQIDSAALQDSLASKPVNSGTSVEAQ